MLVREGQGLGAEMLAEYNGQKFKHNDLVDVIMGTGVGVPGLKTFSGLSDKTQSSYLFWYIYLFRYRQCQGRGAKRIAYWLLAMRLAKGVETGPRRATESTFQGGC